VHPDLAGARPLEAGDHVEQGGRGAVRLAEQRQALAGRYLEADTCYAGTTSIRRAGAAYHVGQLDRHARPGPSAGRGRRLRRGRPAFPHECHHARPSRTGVVGNLTIQPKDYASQGLVAVWCGSLENMAFQHVILALLEGGPSHGWQMKGQIEAALGPEYGGL